MGVMNKLRESTPIILWILVFSFGVIWVLQDSQVFDNMGVADAQTLAVVNGEAISIDEYRRAIDNQMEQYRQQTGESVPEQLLDTYRDRVFDALVENKLREREMDRLGIVVSDAELVDLVLGDDPDPFIRQIFDDGAGNLDRAALQSFLDNPEARDQWIAVEEYLRAKRRQEKLQNLIMASVRVSDAEVADEYLRRNRSADIEFVGLRYAAIPNDSVSVTDADLRDYYDVNRDDFRRDRTFDVAYVAFPKTASAEDSAGVIDELNELRSAFAEVENDSLFLTTKGSARPFTSAYFGADELDPALVDRVFTQAEPGALIGPFREGGEAHLVKVLDVRPAEEPVVRARHILIRAAEGASDSVRQDARRQILDLQQRIADGEDFAALARQYSDDTGSGAQGGALGWFNRERMVEPFADAAFDAEIGEVVGPVETTYGYHLIEVTDRAEQEVQLADLAYAITPSTSTVREMQTAAEDLYYYADESGDFEGEAASAGLDVQEVQIQEGMAFIPGLGQSRQIQNFLASAQEGSTSELIDTPDQYLVLHVRDIEEEGFRSFDEVRDELRPRVVLEKKRELQTERLRSTLAEAGGFDALPAQVGASVQTATGLTFQNTTLPGFGREPAVVGAALGAEAEGTVLPNVIEGLNGAYVVRVTDLRTPDVSTISETEREQIRQSLLQARQQDIATRWIQELRDAADVDDYRVRFNI